MATTRVYLNESKTHRWIQDYRGCKVFYHTEYETFNATRNGSYEADGCNTLEEALEAVDYMLKPRRRDPRVGGLWDTAPLESFTEMDYDD